MWTAGASVVATPPVLVEDVELGSGVAVPGFEIVPLFASPLDSGGGDPAVEGRDTAPGLRCMGSGGVGALCADWGSVGALTI